MKNHDPNNNVVQLSQFQNKEPTETDTLVPATICKVRNFTKLDFTKKEEMFHYNRLVEKYSPDYLQLFVVHLHTLPIIITWRRIGDTECIDRWHFIAIYDSENEAIGLSLSIDEFIQLTCLDPNSITDIEGYLHIYFQSHNITDFHTDLYDGTEGVTHINEVNLDTFHPEEIIVDLMEAFPIVECHFYKNNEHYSKIERQDFNNKQNTVLLLDMLILGLYESGFNSAIDSIRIQEVWFSGDITTRIISKEYISHVIESALKWFSWEYIENYKDIEKAIKHYYKTQLKPKLDVKAEYNNEDE